MLLFIDFPSRNNRHLRQEEHAPSRVLYPRSQVLVYLIACLSDHLSV